MPLEICQKVVSLDLRTALNKGILLAAYRKTKRGTFFCLLDISLALNFNKVCNCSIPELLNRNGSRNVNERLKGYIHSFKSTKSLKSETVQKRNLLF